MTVSQIAELINDVGNWLVGMIVAYQLCRGLRTYITGK